MDVVPAFEETEVEPGVYLATLATGEEMSIQHLRMEPGARVPEHSHHHEQVGFVYEGEMTLLPGSGEAVAVTPGGSYSLAGHEAHAAENQGDLEVLALDVFSPPRPSPNWSD